MTTLDEVVGVLRAHRFRYANEDELQAGIAAALADAGLDVRREVLLTPRDRIDLLVGRVGIEVKVAGVGRDVARQVRRYAESDAIDALVLVTNRVRHQLPAELLGKRVVVVSLLGAGL